MEVCTLDTSGGWVYLVPRKIVRVSECIDTDGDEDSMKEASSAAAVLAIAAPPTVPAFPLALPHELAWERLTLAKSIFSRNGPRRFWDIKQRLRQRYLDLGQARRWKLPPLEDAEPEKVAELTNALAQEVEDYAEQIRLLADD